MAGPELFYLLKPMATIKQAFINQLMVITQSPLKCPPSSCLIHMCIMFQVLFKGPNTMPYACRLCQNPRKWEFEEKILNHSFFKNYLPWMGFQLESLWSKSWATNALDCSAIICWQNYCLFFGLLFFFFRVSISFPREMVLWPCWQSKFCFFDWQTVIVLLNYMRRNY